MRRRVAAMGARLRLRMVSLRQPSSRLDKRSCARRLSASIICWSLRFAEGGLARATLNAPRLTNASSLNSHSRKRVSTAEAAEGPQGRMLACCAPRRRPSKEKENV